MKIAFLSYYSGNVNRGVETFVHELGNNLVKLGHQVVVYQSGPRLPAATYGVNKLVSLYKLPKLDADVVIPTNGRFQSLLCRFWCLIHNKKMIISGQSGLGIDDRFNLWLFPNVFVALTQHQARWVKSLNPFVKLATIPNGVDLEKFSSEIKPLKLNLPGPIILSASALIEAKRPELIIKAVAKLKSGSLLLVGSGERQKELEDLGKELLPGRFKIISIPHDQMPAVYASADLFTFATVPWESFGIVLLEAMATNLPVVVSDDPIRREIVGKAGIFVDPENTDKYAKALEVALKKDWADLSRQQAEKFSWAKIAKQYDQVFRNLTGL